ncbi:ATP-binding protein [Rhodoferax sp.]|uniref:ATP-binding protein n=1 Tax=Rhodoferax sp. TaxID=50421 RepID=UPI001A0F6C6E|nr:4Fe-4S binding protein [Rhodoferax sp.]MBE0473542.1 4Fe-4S binding protein [Rhodoferax sp.]
MTAQIAHIDPTRCTGCGRCISACALGLIEFETRDWKKRSVVQDPERCTGCGDCAERCPFSAISLIEPHQGRRSPL